MLCCRESTEGTRDRHSLELEENVSLHDSECFPTTISRQTSSPTSCRAQPCPAAHPAPGLQPPALTQALLLLSLTEVTGFIQVSPTETWTQDGEDVLTQHYTPTPKSTSITQPYCNKYIRQFLGRERRMKRQEESRAE